MDIAVPVGRRIKPRALAWPKYHCSVAGRLLIFGIGNEEWAAFGPPDFQQDMARRVAEGEALW